jgi:hypothetical protein
MVQAEGEARVSCRRRKRGSAHRRDRRGWWGRSTSLLVEIGLEGWTPTQQPPEFSPSLRSLSLGFYFYLCEERKR